jgi:hypothetical protein
MVVKKRFQARAPGGAGNAPFWVTGPERRAAPLDEWALTIFQPDILFEP